MAPLALAAGLLLAAGVAGGGIYAASQSGMFNSAGPSNPDPGQGSSTDMVNYDEFKDLVGVSVPNGTYKVVLIKDGVTAENFGSAAVTTVGADSDESDTTELFASEDVEKNKDYWVSTDGSFDQLPDSGDYQFAVIGDSTANKYGEASISSEVKKLRTEQDAPLKPMSGVEIHDYATGLTSDTTQVMADGSIIALDADYSDDKSDSEVGGTVTGVKEYTVDPSDAVGQFGEVSVSGVNDSVEKVTVEFMADGETVETVSDSDFSDGEGLDDGVEVADQFVNAQDTVGYHATIEFDDASMTSAGDLATVTVDDYDDDSDSQDGSGHLAAVSETFRGY